MRNPLLLIAMLFVLVTAACSQNDPVVATVGTLEIHQDEVEALRDAADAGLAIPAERFRGDLTRMVIFTAIASGLEEQYDVVITDNEIEARFQEMVSDGTFDRLREQSRNAAAQETDLYDFATDDLYRFVAWGRLISERGQAAIANDEDFLDQVFTDARASVVYTCQRHILVDTEAEAQAVLDRLADGEEFAAVAADMSTDTGSTDGSLPCATADRWVDGFEQAVMIAPVGEVFGPVESQFGFHVLIVDSRDDPTVDELKADPARFLPHPDPEAQLGGFRWHPIVEAEWTAWFNETIRGAEVEVEPRIGTWSSEALGIQSPDPE